jgi:hypothetical protein
MNSSKVGDLINSQMTGLIEGSNKNLESNLNSNANNNETPNSSTNLQNLISKKNSNFI